MPELPEVETIRRELSKKIIGKTIKKIEVRKPKIFIGNPKEVVGRKIEGIERRGKILIIKLSGEKNLLVHFKLTGQMVWVEESEKIILGHPIPFAGTELPAKATHVIFIINGGELLYNDLRQFGWIKIVESSKLKVQSEIAKLGPEPFDKEFTDIYLKDIFARTAKPIKLVLLDQEKIAGIGNIYANEALFMAGILPMKPAKNLTNFEIEKLRESIIQILTDAIKKRGTSDKDEAYRQTSGEKGSFQNYLKVYGKKGGNCPNCKGVIKRVKIGGRGSFYCPACQR